MEEDRKLALTLAIESSAMASTDDLVDRAEKFLNFLNGTPAKEPGASTEGANQGFG